MPKDIQLIAYKLTCFDFEKKYIFDFLNFQVRLLAYPTSEQVIVSLSFVQLGFNLSKGVTDTFQSSSILIYFKSPLSFYQGILKGKVSLYC